MYTMRLKRRRRRRRRLRRPDEGELQRLQRECVRKVSLLLIRRFPKIIRDMLYRIHARRSPTTVAPCTVMILRYYIVQYSYTYIIIKNRNVHRARARCRRLLVYVETSGRDIRGSSPSHYYVYYIQEPDRLYYYLLLCRLIGRGLGFFRACDGITALQYDIVRMCIRYDRNIYTLHMRYCNSARARVAKPFILLSLSPSSL